MIRVPAVLERNISIVTERGCDSVARKVFLILMLLAGSAWADDLIDSSKLNMRRVDEMNMSDLLPAYARHSVSSQTEAPEYNLARMRQMNPDFTTYPEAQGIIWLKHVTVSRHDDGGTEFTRLYVILGRRGLGGKWLNWNIPIPAKGSSEVLEASVYDFLSGAKIGSVTPEEDIRAGVLKVNFSGLPDTFVIALSWREYLSDELSLEGLCWLQEDLRVWESIVEVYSPQQLSYRTFPGRLRPETEDLNTEIAYTWRQINIDPYDSAGGLARLERSGVAFSTRQGTSGITSIMKNIDSLAPDAPEDAVSGFKRSRPEGVSRVIDWLKAQPEITLAEGSPRNIPMNSGLTRAEKVILARSWISQHQIDASLCWELPFEPDSTAPLCSGMFFEPVLELHGVKGFEFHDMTDPKLLAGAKIFSFTNEGRVISRRIPSSKSGENRLSAVMDLRLNEQGMLSGTVRVILRGAWGALMLGPEPTDGTARGAILSLFPGLTNYKDIKYKITKGIPEISFTLENKPGIAGSGRGVLAVLPFFEPVSMRALGGYDAPVEMRFPFVIDQNITLGFPKNSSEALVSGKITRHPDKINYSESYQNRRHRLIAEARFELNMPSISSGNMALLRRNLDYWRAFSARNIPVR